MSNEHLQCDREPAVAGQFYPHNPEKLREELQELFGGWVMAQLDIAGAVAAMKRAKGRVATVAVNAIQFKQPVSVGDLLSFFAEVVSVGRTSISVAVSVFAERDPTAPKVVKVTEAVLTYVALAQDGHKRNVPEAD